MCVYVSYYTSSCRFYVSLTIYPWGSISYQDMPNGKNHYLDTIVNEIMEILICRC